MTRKDFNALFADMAQALQADVDAVTSGVYWEALKDLPAEAIVTAGRGFERDGPKFPTVPQWRQSAQRYVQDQRYAHDGTDVLQPFERAAYLEAERLHWEREPCGCQDCRAAGVADRALRYVPIEEASGVIRPAWLDDSRDRDGKRTARRVVLGEWLHGYPLARFYAAQSAYYEGLYRLIERLQLDRAKMLGRTQPTEAKVGTWPRPPARRPAQEASHD